MKQINFLFKIKIKKTFLRKITKQQLLTDETDELESTLHQTRSFTSLKELTRQPNYLLFR